MDEKNVLDNVNPEMEENEEIVEAEEITEVTEEVEEAAEETEEAETTEDYEEGSDIPEGEAEEITEETTVESDFEVQKSKKGAIIKIVALVIVVIAAIILVVDMIVPKNYTIGDIYVENKKISEKAEKENNSKKEENTEKYNGLGYVNVSGTTLGEWCAENGVDFDRFVKQYNLPEDITEDTYFDVAQYMMPAWVMAEMYGTDFATLKENFELPDTIQVEVTPSGFFGMIKSLFVKNQLVEMEITEDMPWGLIYDEVTLGVLVGEESLETFKEEYGFGEEITAETKWKEVRPVIEKKEKEQKEQEEAAAEEEEAEFEGDEGVEETPETEGAVETEEAEEIAAE